MNAINLKDGTFVSLEKVVEVKNYFRESGISYRELIARFANEYTEEQVKQIILSNWNVK